MTGNKILKNIINEVLQNKLGNNNERGKFSDKELWKCEENHTGNQDKY